MKFKEVALKGIAWTGLQKFINQIFLFFVFALLARLLEPEDFGLVSMATIFVALLQAFVEQGFSSAIIQKKELKLEDLDTAFWASLSMGIFLTITGIFMSGTISDFFNEPKLKTIFQVLSINFILMSLSGVQEAILKREFAFKVLSIRSIISVGIGGAVGVGMALQGSGAWSLVGQQISNSLAQIVILWNASSWRPRLRFSKKIFKQLFLFESNLIGIRLLDFANRRSDNLLIGYFLGPTALGYYTVAYRIHLSLTSLFAGVTGQIALPLFSRMQDDVSRLRETFYKVSYLTSILATPIFFGIAFLTPELISLFFGEKWLPSVPVMRVLSLMGLLFSITFFHGPVMLSLGKPSWNLQLRLINAVSNFISFVIAVRWGIFAVAVAYVVRGYMVLPISVLLVKKLIHIDLLVYLKSYSISFFSSAIMLAGLFTLKHLLQTHVSGYIALCCYIAIGASTYSFVLWLIKPDLYGEILQMYNEITRSKKKKVTGQNK